MAQISDTWEAGGGSSPQFEASLVHMESLKPVQSKILSQKQNNKKVEERLKEKFKIQLIVVESRGEDFLNSGPRIGIKDIKDLQYSQQDVSGPLDGVFLIFTCISQSIPQSGIQNKDLCASNLWRSTWNKSKGSGEWEDKECKSNTN